MSWRERFTGKGSLDGAGFFLDVTTLETGRRVQVHEYPKRDNPYAEDLGRKAREFSFEAYCIGPDYLREKEALIAVAEKPGSKELVHPFYGRRRVTITRFQVKETTREGGYASISITCIAASEIAFPQTAVATRQQVSDAADATTTSLIANFEKSFSAIDQAVGQVEAMLDAVEAVIGSVTTVTATITQPISDIIRAPAELATAVAGSITSVAVLITEPLDALALYDSLIGSSAFDSAAISASNPSPRALAEALNQQALNGLVRGAAIAGSAAAMTRLQPIPDGSDDLPLTRSDALRVRDALTAAIDAEQLQVSVIDGLPIDDALYAVLADLRQAVMADLSVTVGRLPLLKAYTPGATLPALVIAHQLYGDATRDAQIVALNNIRHPGFVPGGDAIEVLATGGALDA